MKQAKQSKRTFRAKARQCGCTAATELAEGEARRGAVNVIKPAFGDTAAYQLPANRTGMSGLVKAPRRHFEPVDTAHFAGVKGWVVTETGAILEIRENGETRAVQSAINVKFLEKMKRHKVIRETRQNWNEGRSK